MYKNVQVGYSLKVPIEHLMGQFVVSLCDSPLFTGAIILNNNVFVLSLDSRNVLKYKIKKNFLFRLDLHLTRKLLKCCKFYLTS